MKKSSVHLEILTEISPNVCMPPLYYLSRIERVRVWRFIVILSLKALEINIDFFLAFYTSMSSLSILIYKDFSLA